MMLMRKDMDKEQEEGGETGQSITGLGMGTQKHGLVCIVGVVLCRAEHLMNGCEECTISTGRRTSSDGRGRFAAKRR
jgi:hypothetical protein